MSRAAVRAKPTERPAWEQKSLDRVGRQASQRSQKIVDAARELVEEGGLEAVTLRPLLERSGLSRRAFYERFAGMDDVLMAVFEDTMAGAVDVLGKRAARADGALGKMESLVRNMVSMGRSPSRRVYMMAMSSEYARLAETRPAELREAKRPLNRLMAEILAEGMASRAVRKADPDALAEMVHSLVAAEAHRNLQARDKRWIDDLCAFCVSAIRAR